MGWNIFRQTDGNYLVNGWGIDQTIGQPEIFNIKISSDGQFTFDKKRVRIPATAYYLGNSGQMAKIFSGYIAPVTVQNPSTSYLTSRCGILKYDSAGDTVFVKLYTDTAIYFDMMNCVTTMPNGDYMIGGERGTNVPSYSSAILMRINTLGDTLWTHTHQKNPIQNAKISTIIPLADSRIVAAASTRYTYFIGSEAFYHHSPWFMLLDANGNIIRDTVYGAKYGLGGFLYKDLNGGYIHFGWIDTVAVPADAENLQNLPYYIAHLDTNFRIEWLTRFPFSDCNSRRTPWQIKQLHDSTYLILGDDYCNGCSCGAPAYSGWAAKISKTGEILWNRDYWTDTDNVAYLRDMVELPDGNMVFVGSAFNDTLPGWHAGRDVWIFGTDANGCITPMCGTTAVPEVESTPKPFALYPNPSAGGITVTAAEAGELLIYNIQGQVVATYAISAGPTAVELPRHLASGTYLCRYTTTDGNRAPEVVRLIYSP